jgi:hypothetical protein
MITPALAEPSSLMKPEAALFDSVMICAAEPAARSAFTPSVTAVPEPIHSTACAFALVSCGTIAA